MTDAIKPRGTTGGLQVRRQHRNEWTPQKREQFLDHLSATCNVMAAAQSVGVATTNCYKLRRRDTAFAAAWTSALEAGYQHLEAKLLSLALGNETYQPADPEAVARPFDPEAAMRLLGQHARIAAHGWEKPTRRGPKYVQVSIEQVEASLRKQLAVVAKRAAKRL